MIQQNQTSLHDQFTLALKSYEKELRSYAFFKVSNLETSIDLVQDTFIKAWNYITKGGQINTMKSFLYHILNNLIIDQYRKHKTISLNMLFEEGFEPAAGDSNQIVNILDGQVAMNLTGRLPEKYKKVISMKYIEDLSLEEISVMTGVSKNTVAVQIHRGLKKLKIFCTSQ